LPEIAKLTVIEQTPHGFWADAVDHEDHEDHEEYAD
jgi:hypothetical protein